MRRRRAVVLDEPEDDQHETELEPQSEPEQDEAAESLASDVSAASFSIPNGADEDGREVAHDNMNH